MRRWIKKLTQAAILAVAVLVFTAGLLARYSEAQQEEQEVEFTIQEFTPDSVAYRLWWDYAVRCSGITPQEGGEYEDIKWFAYTPKLYNGPFRILGYWKAPDSIFVDSLLLDDMSTVTHEMLHHLQRGPDLPDSLGGSHPFRPFVNPCGVGVTVPNYNTGVEDGRSRNH